MTKRSNKREKLLNAAAEAFWQKGYTATSLADIANQSGISLGNIYYYFKTKTAFAEGVAEIYITASKEALEAIDKNFEKPEHKLTAFINLLKESAESRTEKGCPLANAIRDFSKNAPEASQKTNQVFEMLINWLKDKLEQAGDANPAQHAQEAIARWQGAIILAQASKDKTYLSKSLTKLGEDMNQWVTTRIRT